MNSGDSRSEEAIRVRAYELWEQEGRPDGRHEEHWRMASYQSQPSDHDGALGQGGISSSLHPGGELPGGSPAAGMGAIGTGGGSTAGRSTGSRRARS